MLFILTLIVRVVVDFYEWLSPVGHVSLVFEDVSNIRVVEDLDTPQPELVPILGHSTEGESATSIPLREIRLNILTLME
jgi:hypothetical protein